MFKDKLKKLRKQHHMTQEELAEKLFVSRDLVAKWEAGKRYPTEETAGRISEIFNISLRELLGGDEEAMDCCSELSDCIPKNNFSSAGTDSDEEEIKLLTSLISSFLRSVSKEDKNLFLRRYYYNDSLEKLEKSTGLSKEIIGVRLAELRVRMLNYFERTDNNDRK